jgi:hypothetical protein
LEGQTGNEEGSEEDRKKTFSGTPKGYGLTFNGVEGLYSTGVSTISNLQGMASRFDCYIDRFIHIDRSSLVAINHNVVGTASNLYSNRFMRQLQHCYHGRTPFP